MFVFLFLTYFTLHNRLQVHPPHQNWLECVPFVAEWYPVVCMYPSFLTHSSADGPLGCFHVLATLSSAATSVGARVSLSVLVSSGHVPRSGIAGSYGGFIPGFFRNLQTVFRSGCINVPSHQQRKKAPFSPHPLQHWLCVSFLTMAILTAVRWQLIVALICVFLMRGIEHLLMCLSAIHTASLEKCLFRSFALFLIGLFVLWYWVVWAAYIFWK